MRRNSTGSFFARFREKLFKRRLSLEIHDRMFPHLRQEDDYGYLFSSDEEMNAQTEALDVQIVLERIERQVNQMPKAYGECFRHIMHRDLHEAFRRYERAARRAVHPKDPDPRFVATRYESATQ